MKPSFTKSIRLFASLLCLGISNICIAGVSSRGRLEPFIVFVLFMAYAIVQGVLITLLARILYAQHGVEKLRFGTSALMVVTTILAIPMAFTSLIVRSSDQPSSYSIAIFCVVVLLFVLYPILVICEAIATARQS